MERLTKLIKNRWMASCKIKDISLIEFQQIIVNKLAEYENTGLIPKEIEQLQKENTELKSRLEKSVELPCKVGDKIYFSSYFMSGILIGEVEEIIFDKWGYKIKIKQGRVFEDRELGIKFFTDLEEAEQTLKGEIK